MSKEKKVKKEPAITPEEEGYEAKETLKATKETIKEILGEPGNYTPLAEKLLKDVAETVMKRDLEYKRAGGDKSEDIKKELLEEIRRGGIETFKATLQKPEYRDTLYLKSYTRLRALEHTGINYSDLLTEIYEDSLYLNEIFVRIVEEDNEVKITSGKQLLKLTGITELNPEGSLHTLEDMKAEAIRQMENTFTNAMMYRYTTILEGILELGGKYKDLLKVDPSSYYLPESSREEAIRKVIANLYELNRGSMYKPDLRSVAEAIEAPYSVILKINKEDNE